MRNTIKKIFDKTDYLSDEQRKDNLLVWNNKALIEKTPELALLGKEKTIDDLYQICKHSYFGLWYGDHYSTNENYPLVNPRYFRRRIWTSNKGVLRVEMSKAFVEAHAESHINIVSSKL